MTHLTPEERVLGRENANRALGVSRRDLLKAAAAAPALGAFYFGYGDMKGKSAGSRGHHRHRRRGLPGDDPVAQPRISRFRRVLRHPAVAAGAGRQGILQPQRLQLRRRQEAQAVRHQGRHVRRPRRRDDRDRAAALAARAGGDRGDERGQARLHREADGPLGRRVQGDVPGRPQEQPAAGRRPPAPLFRPLRQRQLPGPERRAGRHSPHPGPLAPQQRDSRWSPRTRTATRSTTPRPGWPSTFTTRTASRSTATVGSESTPSRTRTSTTRNTATTAWTS